MDAPDTLPASSPILARADALMQRRRQGAGEGEDLPVLTEVVASDDDLPVLNDALPAADSGIDPASLAELADELAARVRARLAAEIPSLVEAALHAALAGLTADLQQGISETTADALRDFIVERERQAKAGRR